MMEAAVTSWPPVGFHAAVLRVLFAAVLGAALTLLCAMTEIPICLNSS